MRVTCVARACGTMQVLRLGEFVVALLTTTTTAGPAWLACWLQFSELVHKRTIDRNLLKGKKCAELLKSTHAFR